MDRAACHTRRNSSLSLKTRSRERSEVGGFTPAQGNIDQYPEQQNETRQLANRRKCPVGGDRRERRH